ncbi:MAG TPA: hypothetical protein VNZ54_06030, partial [bacterium]|nr:hypothetical protein [bacterium]
DFTSQLTYATLQNGYNIAATLQALINSSKADLISSPNITINDNLQAHINATDQVVLQQSTQSVSNGTITTTNTFTTLPLALDLLVTPRVAVEDRRVFMNIVFTLNTQTGSPASQGAPPPTSVQTANTQVNVASGETAVIGGLVRQSITTNEGKVPVLGDIPLLGMLFRFKSDSKIKREIIIFITPSIVEN